LTVDNTEATVSQGTKIPYATVSASGTSVQLINATLSLKVVPHITPDNQVFMKVEVSNNRPDFSQAVNGQPAIEVKEATTEVMVRNGDTTVLGGVYTINESQNVNGVPGLMKVPLLGWLFKGTLKESSRKELLVFITPHIVLEKAGATD
jgi:type IV pilus assembly protein PilQ